jgi:hypothetical protein
MEIEGTKFGSITIDRKTYEHDVVIRLSAYGRGDWARGCGTLQRWCRDASGDIRHRGFFLARRPHNWPILQRTFRAYAASMKGRGSKLGMTVRACLFTRVSRATIRG